MTQISPGNRIRRTGRIASRTAITAITLALAAFSLAHTTTALGATCSSGNGLQDSSFETSTENGGTITNSFWNSSSDVFGSPLCSASLCGDGQATARPRTGAYWVWFGGTNGPDTDSASQALTIPAGAGATLNYQLWIGGVTSPFTDTFSVIVDGTVVQTITEPPAPEAGYGLHSVNLNAYADGNLHTITFRYTTPSGGGIANFSLDDITLDVVCPSNPPVPTPTAARLLNISTRGLVLTGNNVMIGGFIVKGPGPRKVMVRALGPSLTAFGLTNALGDPRLELHESSAVIAANDDWQITQLGGVITANQSADIQTSGLSPTHSKESALIVSLAPGNYTAVVQGTNDTMGTALVEVYDLATGAGTTLSNISTREFVGTGNDVMIGGLIVGGSASANIIIRGIGPSLADFGITNPLQDPMLELHDGNGQLWAANDDWAATQQAQITATNLTPSKNPESAIVATLAPGNYTAIVRGKNNSTGVALVEAFLIEADTAYFPPYFTMNGTFGVAAHGPVPILLPDGTVVPDGTDQLIVFLDFNAGIAQMQGVATLLANSNATVVGQIPAVHELQVQMKDVNKSATLLSSLRSAPGVLDAQPNLISNPDQCSGSGVQGTSWTSADNLVTPPVASNNVIIGVLDCFNPASAPAGPGSSRSHGEVVEAFIKDASGTLLSSKVTRVASTCGLDAHGVLKAAADFVVANPGKKIVFNASMGAGASSVLGSHVAWYSSFKSLSQALSQQFGDRVIFVKSGGNGNVFMPANPGLVGCNFVAAGGLNQSTTTGATKADFSNNGPVISTFAPACGVTPDAGFGSERFFGTSFAAPQVAGQLAAIWAKNPSLTGCQIAGQVTNLPAVNGFRRFDAKKLETLVAPAPCSTTQVAGGDTAESRSIQMGKVSGTFNFSYDTYSIPDRMVVSYEGKTLFDTGCVGASGSVKLNYSGTSTTVTVQVTPNCTGGSGTQWTFTVDCPM